MFLLRFLVRIIFFPIYFLLSVLVTFATLIVNFACWIIGVILFLVFICGICAAFMHDFHSVGFAFVLVAGASVIITIIGFAQGFLEIIRDSVGDVVFG